jgi:hypothetical protein
MSACSIFRAGVRTYHDRRWLLKNYPYLFRHSTNKVDSINISTLSKQLRSNYLRPLIHTDKSNKLLIPLFISLTRGILHYNRLHISPSCAFHPSTPESSWLATTPNQTPLRTTSRKMYVYFVPSSGRRRSADPTHAMLHKRRMRWAVERLFIARVRIVPLTLFSAIAFG